LRATEGSKAIPRLLVGDCFAPLGLAMTSSELS
jgi:hypothetical protein